MVTEELRTGRKRLGVLVESHAWASGHQSQAAQADFYEINHGIYRQIVKNSGSYRINNETVDKLVDKGLDRDVVLALRNGDLVGDAIVDSDLRSHVEVLRALPAEHRQSVYQITRMLAAAS